MNRARKRWIAWTLALVALAAAGPGRADDVPDAARKDYQAALDLLAKGDPAKAFSAISKGKDKAPDSVDFWVAFVRIWRANAKPEKTLWDTIIRKRQEANPKSTTFDLVAARVEADPAKRKAAYEAVVAKDPKCLEARIFLAQALLAAGDEDAAEEAIDAVMAEFPDADEAAVGKAEILMGRGQTNAAIELLEERLGKKEVPALRRIYARALARKAENDPTFLERAVESARKAWAGDPTPEAAVTLAELLERTGDVPGALKVLEEAQAKGPSPEVGTLLGDYAFREGKFDLAAKHLAPAADGDLKAAKGLAVCHARLGRAKEAGEALARVLRLDAGQRAFAARVALSLLDGPGARRHLEGASGDEADFLRAEAWALEGNVAEVTKLVGAKAAEGTRLGEDLLLMIVQARLHGRLGGKAPALLKASKEAQWKANAAGPPTPARPKEETPRTAKTAGYMQRFVTYRASLCGTWFAPRGMQPHFTLVGGKPHVGFAVVAEADCEPDGQRLFPFNMQAVEGGQVTISLPTEGWDEAETAFQAGCAALVKEDYDAAGKAFGEVLEKEDAFTRAKLFAAVAKAFAAAPDLPGAAALAKAVATELPEEMQGRRVAALLRALAGEDVAAELAEMGTVGAGLTLRRLSAL